MRVDRAQILAILALELEGTSLAGQSGSSAATQVRLRCEDLEEIGIEVQDPLTKKSLARGIDLAGVQPNARARLIALAVAELVTASWMELEARGRRTAVSQAPVPTTTFAVVAARDTVAARAEPAPAPETRLAVLMHGRVLGDETPLWGAGLRFARDRGTQLCLSLDVVFERGARTLPPDGTIRADALSGAVALQYRPLTGIVSAFVGAGLRGGAVWIEGQRGKDELIDERTFVAPWGGPVLTAVGSWRVVRHFVVELGVESGYAVVAARGLSDQGGGFGLSGLWLGFSLAMGYGT